MSADSKHLVGPRPMEFNIRLAKTKVPRLGMRGR